MSNQKAKYLVIDTETTGLHPGLNGLIDLAAAALDANLEIIETFQMDVKPPEGVEFDPVSMEINGMSQERIENGCSYNELCERFLVFIRSHFVDKPIAIGQFYPFDYAFLDHVFTVSGYGRFLSDEVLGNSFIDTKSMALTLNLIATQNGQDLPFPSTSLSKAGGLKDTLGISKDYVSHTALGDVLATRDVLVKLLEFQKGLMR